jgi:hypothetical protein
MSPSEAKPDHLSMPSSHRRVTSLFPLWALLACASLPAQETPPAPSDQQGGQATNSAEALQKATQNPVADLISVPLQNNMNFGVGPYNGTQNVLNIQPVIPVHLTSNWNLINRIIAPVVWQPYTGSNPANASLGTFGLGDLNPSLFLSPAHPGAVIWGAGPAFVLPTATDPALGQGKWSIGPSFVVLAQPGHWTLGLLANNVWSFAGQSNRPTVNQFLTQYFINYNLAHGWYLTSAPIITANWAAPQAKNVWTVPFGGGVGQITKVGNQPINWQLSAYANAVYPAGTSPWGIRLQLAFLFPQLTPQQQQLMLEEKLKQLKSQ